MNQFTCKCCPQIENIIVWICCCRGWIWYNSDAKVECISWHIFTLHFASGDFDWKKTSEFKLWRDLTHRYLGKGKCPNKQDEMNDYAWSIAFRFIKIGFQRQDVFFVQRILLLCTKENLLNWPTIKYVAQLLKSLSQSMDESGDNEVGESSFQNNEIAILPIQMWKGKQKFEKANRTSHLFWLHIGV